MNFSNSGPSDPRFGGTPGLPHRGQRLPARTPAVRSTAAGSAAGSGNPPAVLQNAPSFPDLVRGLQRRLLPALSLGLVLGTAAALGAWFLVASDKYSASSWLEVRSSATSMLSTTRTYEPQTAIRSFQVTQETYLRSRLVLGSALRRPEILPNSSVFQKADPIQWLAENLEVAFEGDVMTITLRGDNPGELIGIVNAVTAAYLSEVVNAEHNRRAAQYDALKKKYGEYVEEITERREVIKQQLTQLAGTEDAETLQVLRAMALTEVDSLRNELAHLRSEQRSAELELELLLAGDGEETQAAGDADEAVAMAAPLPAVLDAAVNNHPAVQDLQAEAETLRQTLGRYRQVVRNESDPAIRRVRGELQAADSSLAAMRNQVRLELVRQFQDDQQRQLQLQQQQQQQLGGKDTSELNREYLVRKLQLLEEYEKSLDQQYQAAQAKAQSLHIESEVEDEIAQIEEAAKKVASAAEMLKVELDAPPRVSRIEDAEVATPLSARKKFMATGAAGLGTLGLILCGFSWWDARTRRVDRIDDVVRGLGLNLIGVLPALPAPRNRLSGPSRNGNSSWEHLLMDSVDATRTMLLYAQRTEQLRVLMVTSAVKGEGKTSLSCHLATSMARARQRTLLIDCDLRRPSIHTLFDQPASPGVCELLRGEATLANVVQATPAPGLSLITAGACDPTAIAALAQGRFPELIAAVRDQYDFIIVDSAPVLPVADSLQIGQHVDAVIFSVLREVSRLPKIYEAYERLSQLGVRLLGAVVSGNRNNPDNDDAYYGYAGHNGSPVGSASDH